MIVDTHVLHFLYGDVEVEYETLRIQVSTLLAE